ncbi:MAG TPA: hypothetical protein VL087_11005 [Nitrospirota bacterium]|nr:hypothetical protein [Nitrospirota bacterium]
MLTGYNTDFTFQGKLYHVQTEDGGIKSPSITSLLYQQGAILASRKTSYADIIKADCLEEVVRELMKEQHKQMIRDLMQGKLQSQAPVQPPTPEPAPKAASIKEPLPEPATAADPAAAPAPNREVKEKSLDEIILDFLGQEQKGQKQEK